MHISRSPALPPGRLLKRGAAMQNTKLSVLVRNELIKIRSRKLNVVFAAALLAITLLTLAGYASMSRMTYDDDGYKDNTDEMAEHYLARAEEVKNGDMPFESFFDCNTVPADLAALEMLEYARLYQYAYDTGIKDSGDWRYYAFDNFILSSASQNVIVDQIENGKEHSEYILQYIDTYGFDLEQIKRTAETCDEYCQKLPGMRYAEYINDYYLQKQDEYLAFESRVSSLGEISEGKQLEYTIKREFYQAALYAYNYIIINDLDADDVMTKQAENIADFTSSYYYNLTVSEYYEYAGYETNIINQNAYREYLKECESTFEQYRMQLDAGRYCLDHGVYDVATSGDSRAISNAFFGLFSTLYIYALIVFGTVSAGEFSPKTVNMLLIRPVSRTKIMQSKFIASLITVLTVFFGCFAVYQLGALLITKATDFLQPVFIDFFGNVTAIPYPVHMLFEFICCCASAVMLGTFSFMLATLTRNAITGILLGIASTVFSSITSFITALINANVYLWYPLTYATLWDNTHLGITCSPYYYSIYNISNNIISSLFGLQTSGESMIYGLIIAVLLAALWLFCAVSNFKRRDI